MSCHSKIRKSSGSYITEPVPRCPLCGEAMVFEAEDWEGDPTSPGLMHRIPAYWSCGACEYDQAAERVYRDCPADD